ncbi:toxin of the YeeV-YeeU toxin-antitoxin system, partial [Escherichia coli]
MPTPSGPVVTFIWLFILRPKRKVTLRNSLLLRPGAFSTPLFHFLYLHIRKIFSMKT